MTHWVVTRTISAPVEVVFKTVAHIDEFSRALPHIVKVEFLSGVRSGVGTRFRETRRMKGRDVSTELEVTEYVANDRVRIVSDSHGTIWDTTFSVRADGGRTLLSMRMDAKTENVVSKILNFFIKGMVAKAIANDMDAVKNFCEKRSGA